MTDDQPTEPAHRRSFLGFLTLGLGAIFSAVLGVPITCYVLDPRHRKGAKGDMKLVDGVRLLDLDKEKPAQGVVRDTRLDGWTLYPNDVLGRVWVVRKGERPANLITKDDAVNFNKDADKKKAYLDVFTTICPHLGCAVNLNGAGNGFACPCHAATFNLDGLRANAANPAQRGMDLLAWEIDIDDPELNRIKVTYKRYGANNAKKIPLGGGDEEPANL